MKIVNWKVELESITPDAMNLIEDAARTCYKSEGLKTPGSADRLIKSCMGRGHGSILEHASASFRIITDRAIGNEVARHRHTSLSQESTRYCSYNQDKFDKSIAVILPSGMSEASVQVWLEACIAAETAYFKMLELGEKPEVARSVLPLCLKTEFVMTTNFRQWKYFIDIRKSPKAHADIRVIANTIQAILVDKYPVIFGE